MCSDVDIWGFMRISDQQRGEVKKLLGAGVSPAEIARRFGLSAKTIYRIRDLSMPRKEGAAYHDLKARVSGAELAGLDRIARAMGLTRAALVRQLVRHADDFATISEEESRFLAESMSHIGKLGGNFNQIAKALSQSKLMIGKAEPSEVQRKQIMNAKREVVAIKSIVRQIVKNGQTRRNALMERLASPIGDDDAE